MLPLAGSAACGEGDDFEARTRLDERAPVIARKNRLFVQFDDDGFSGETEMI